MTGENLISVPKKNKTPIAQGVWKCVHPTGMKTVKEAIKNPTSLPFHAIKWHFAHIVISGMQP